jgi:hypothetical protein
MKKKQLLYKLRYHKNWTSLDQIPRGDFFPEYIFDAESAAIFFASATQGKNDVIHFYDRNFKNVLVNDVKKMDLMKKLYPKEWTYITGDAVTAVKKLNKRNQKYDIVTCDTGMKMLYENFNDFYSLANKYFCMFISDLGIERLGLIPTLESLSEYFNKPIKEMFIRPDSGQTYNKYWLIFGKEMLK